LGDFVIKLPDVGEGVAEAELVEWRVKVGDVVREDEILAAVMTDKATVEIPSPVNGAVAWLGASVGDQVAVGSPLVRLDVGGKAPAEAPPPAEPPRPPPEPKPPETKGPPHAPPRAAAPRLEGERPLASPAVRQRAREAGVDLRQVAGSGPAGRINQADLDAFLAQGRAEGERAPGFKRRREIEDVKLVGMRRKIAEKMALAKARIPHITYVEEIDVTALEELRATLNKRKRADQPKLTLLPFLMRAMVRALDEQPALNALFDDEAGVIHRHAGVHIGVATQTPAGLVVPVVRHAEARDLWDCARELDRLAQGARAGSSSREELSGSTITISSLGAMGGVATTPIINYPEVAVVGVNKIMMRPSWDGAGFVPRKMMNLSSSFDHRVVDGWDAAVFVQRIKALLETPAMIFMGD
jgi:2-oxoisovalerate dehydrogenase E2 component (dihydrolipoyl transacylase)